jgi:NADPH-dependent ferric siderophore reductase
MGIIDNFAKRLLNQATVISKKLIAENAFHLTIQGDSLKNMQYITGEHLRIFVGLNLTDNLNDKVRTYSVWRYDHIQTTIDLVICTHSDGIGSKWVHQLQIGQEVYFSNPKGKFIIDNSADYYLLIGDASALAHLYEINRNLISKKDVKAFFYSKRLPELFKDIDGSQPFNFYEFPENPINELIPLIEEALATSQGKGIVYVGGDGRVCVALNQYFKQKGWNKHQIKIKPFWMPNKTGLE